MLTPWLSCLPACAVAAPSPPPVCHSEPEVQVLLSLAKELKPHVWLNVHSGMYALFTPYDHKGHVPNTTGTNMAGMCCHIYLAAAQQAQPFFEHLAQAMWHSFDSLLCAEKLSAAQEPPGF